MDDGTVIPRNFCSLEQIGPGTLYASGHTEIAQTVLKVSLLANQCTKME